MRLRLSRSALLKLTALAVSVVCLLLWYEAQIFDSLEVGSSEATTEYPSPGSTLLFNATAYCKGTTTASGVRVRSGIAAADPALLPIGSVVSIASSRTDHDGIYTVLDTGPLVKGRRLDLYIWSCYEALRFGRRNVDVTVLRLGWDPDASAPEAALDAVRRREAARALEATTPASVGDEPDPEAAAPADPADGAFDPESPPALTEPPLDR